MDQSCILLHHKRSANSFQTVWRILPLDWLTRYLLIFADICWFGVPRVSGCGFRISLRDHLISSWTHIDLFMSLFLCSQGKLLDTTVADEATWTLGGLWLLSFTHTHTVIHTWNHCQLIPPFFFCSRKRTSAWFGSSWWRRIERQGTAGPPCWRESTALMPGSRTRCRKNSLWRDFSGRSVVVVNLDKRLLMDSSSENVCVALFCGFSKMFITAFLYL